MYKTTVALEEMHFYAYHGFYEQERKMGNDFYLTVKCRVDSFDSADDAIHDTINYEDLYRVCSRQMEDSQLLLETVAANILNEIRQTWENVASAQVILKKATPQLGGRVKFSTVTLEF